MLQRVLRLLTSIAFLVTVLAATALSIFYLFGRGLPAYDHLYHYEPPMMSRLYSSDAQLLHEYAVEKRLFVPLYLIPTALKEAFLAAEDKNFFYHFGIDIPGTFRAMLMNTISGSWGKHPGGASSITQQVAKNFLIGNERSFTRKIKEAIMAVRLEYALPKERIFELYLNQIYLGAGAYGVAAAALIYFDKELNELTLEEMAFIAALPKAPTSLTARSDFKRVLARRNWVIDRMQEDGFISQDDAEQAKLKPLKFRKHREIPIKADYFTDAVRREIVDKLGRRQLEEGGLSIHTTLDPTLQTIADIGLRQGLIDYDRRHGWRGPITHFENISETDIGDSLDEPWLLKLKSIPLPDGLGSWDIAVILDISTSSIEIGLPSGLTSELDISDDWNKRDILSRLRVGDVIVVSEKDDITHELQQIPEITGAVVIISPNSGRILAMTGGFDYAINQFNCATMAKRQPGSVFKPFVYLAALEKGYSPTTKILDAPISIYVGGARGYYTPQNYSKKYYGPCELRVGVEQSRNVMTIRLAQSLGMNSIIDIARDFGIHPKLPKQLAMALGAAETSVLAMTTAYAMIANGGKKVTPYLIDSVQDRYGDTLLKAPPQPETQIASPKAINGINDMLVGVVKKGTAKRLQSLGFDVAGKTGTTNDYKDAWFIGYSKDLVVGVFVGYPTPKSLGDGETGSKVSVPIFEYIMRQAYQDKKPPMPLTSLLKNEEDSTIEIINESTLEESANSAFQLSADPVSMNQQDE